MILTGLQEDSEPTESAARSVKKVNATKLFISWMQIYFTLQSKDYRAPLIPVVVKRCIRTCRLYIIYHLTQLHLIYIQYTKSLQSQQPEVNHLKIVHAFTGI